MAQRKSPSAPKSPGSRPGGSGKPAPGRPAGKVDAPPPGRPGGRPPAKKGKSIVNQKQTPWGMIISTVVVVLFAVGVVIVVIATHKSSSNATSTTKGGQAVNKNDPYRQPALPAAMKIKDVTYRVEGQHTHKPGVIKYDTSPPVGGNHDQYWANCNGAIYDHQIANENAVHMLEH